HDWSLFVFLFQSLLKESGEKQGDEREGPLHYSNTRGAKILKDHATEEFLELKDEDVIEA
ncbi:2479_t:CDS:2, partial [Funneliformis mosseae]